MSSRIRSIDPTPSIPEFQNSLLIRRTIKFLVKVMIGARDITSDLQEFPHTAVFKTCTPDQDLGRLVSSKLGAPISKQNGGRGDVF